jgi:hypothetical protein
MMEYTLESILDDKELRVEFIFYVNKIHAQESLLFWMEVEMFKLITDSDECFKQAKLLYFRYIHPSARAQINVSAKLKDSLEATMATGIWDPTLYNEIQVSVHEVLKYSVVRDFCQFMSKQGSGVRPDHDSVTYVMLERYEGALQRHEKEKDYGTVRVRGPNLGLGGLFKKKKKSMSVVDKSKKSSFMSKGQSKVKVNQVDVSLGVVVDDPDKPDEMGGVLTKDKQGQLHRKRLTQHSLQQQIQLLRTLHQHQHDSLKEPDHQYNTAEFSNPTATAPLAKSISMPAIMRGISMANLKGK